MARKASEKADGKALGRVLVVEDDAVLAMNLDAMLLDNGASTVTICSTTKKALDALEADRYDVVVLDVHLADRDDGWSVAELVTQIGPRQPAIVFATGAPEDIPTEIAELGVVLEKPYGPDELVEAIERQRAGSGILAKLRAVVKRKR